jgi:predicted nucleic acid-binding protein
VTVVVDASVTLAWHFQDEASEYADSVLDLVGREGAVVPPVWNLEVANGLLQAERRNRLTRSDVAHVLELLADLSIGPGGLTVEQALGPVLDLAREHDLSAYDAAYLELALREGLALATQDVDMRQAAVRSGIALVE